MPRPETSHPSPQLISEYRYEIGRQHGLPRSKLERGLAPGPLRVHEVHPFLGLQIMELVPVTIHEVQDTIEQRPNMVAVVGISYWVELSNKPIYDKVKRWTAVDEQGMLYELDNKGVPVAGKTSGTTTARSGVTLRSREPVGFFVDPEFLGEEEDAIRRRLGHGATEPQKYVIPPMSLFKKRPTS